jgi:hypothetical protein
MSEIKHRTVETNGIRMHIAEQGAGPSPGTRPCCAPIASARLSG